MANLPNLSQLTEGSTPLFHKLKRYPRGQLYVAREYLDLTDIHDHIVRGTYKNCSKRKEPGKRCLVEGYLMNRFEALPERDRRGNVVNVVRNRYTHLIELSGWLAFDIDDVISRKVAAYIRDSLIDHPNIYLSYLSNSGLGVAAIGYFGAPEVAIKDLKAEKETAKVIVRDFYFNQTTKLRSCLGIYADGVEFDTAQSRVMQPRWMSYDPEAKIKPLL